MMPAPFKEDIGAEGLIEHTSWLSVNLRMEVNFYSQFDTLLLLFRPTTPLCRTAHVSKIIKSTTVVVPVSVSVVGLLAVGGPAPCNSSGRWQ